MPFQTIKKEDQTDEKLRFSQGVTQQFWSKIGPFSILFFLSNIAQQNVSYDILEQKTPLKALKYKKIHIFTTAKPMVFVKKKGPFFKLFYKAIKPRKKCYTIFQNKKPPFQARKKRSPSIKKIKFFQRGKPMLLIQKCLFFHQLFQKKQIRNMCFTII